MRQDPCRVFGIDSDATPEAIRKRYLELVREFPPEQAPERFAEIREAFEELQDPLRNLDERIFSIKCKDSIDSLVKDIQKRMAEVRLPTATLLAFAES